MHTLRHLILLVLVTLATTLAAQDYITLSGTVTDRKTHQPLPHASVVADLVGTVTNEQGRFTLKVPPQSKTVTVSLIGYHSLSLPVEADCKALAIQLMPSAVTLNEVVVHSHSAAELVFEAIAKFPRNYSRHATSYKGFYREVIQKRRQYIGISEAVVEMYKTDYSSGVQHDAVAIRRGRRMINMSAADTLAVKLRGGPTLPIFADLTKNPEFLFYPDDLPCYRYTYAGEEKLDNRIHYVVQMTPEEARPYALLYATLYIDRQSLTITRADLHLDLRNRARATETMLYRRPVGLRFTPLELTFRVDYRTVNGTTYLSYIRNTMRFKCDWHRRLFASPYSVVSEFVVTDILPEAQTIRRRDTFNQSDNLYDNVAFFAEPDFWGANNIIEPTEPLNKAIDKLKRSVLQSISN